MRQIRGIWAVTMSVREVHKLSDVFDINLKTAMPLEYIQANIQRVLFELLPLQGEGGDGDGFYAADLTHPPLAGRT